MQLLPALGVQNPGLHAGAAVGGSGLLAGEKYRWPEVGGHDLVDEDQPGNRRGNLDFPLHRQLKHQRHQLQRVLDLQPGQCSFLGIRDAAVGADQPAVLDLNLRGVLHPLGPKLRLLPAVPGQPPGEVQGDGGQDGHPERARPRGGLLMDSRCIVMIISLF